MSTTDPGPGQPASAPPSKDPYSPRAGGLHSRREARLATRAARRGMGASGAACAWVGGAVLILVGVLLFVQNVGGVSLGAWWGLLILVPAAGAFAAAWRAFSAAGTLTRTAWRSLVAGLALTFMVVFSTSFIWIWMFPLILIAAGVGSLIGFMLPA